MAKTQKTLNGEEIPVPTRNGFLKNPRLPRKWEKRLAMCSASDERFALTEMPHPPPPRLPCMPSERPTTEPQIKIPADIELDEANDRLTYRWATAKAVRPGPGLLEEFVQLERQPRQNFRQYARRRGVLGICKHGLPATHRPAVRPGVTWLLSSYGCSPRFVKRPADHYPRSSRERKLWEPLGAWRRFTAEAGALLRLVEALQSRRSTDASDWQTLYKHDPFIRETGRSIPW